MMNAANVGSANSAHHRLASHADHDFSSSLSPLRCDTASCAGCGVQLNASLPIENRMHGLFSFKPMFIVNVESLYVKRCHFRRFKFEHTPAPAIFFHLR